MRERLETSCRHFSVFRQGRDALCLLLAFPIMAMAGENKSGAKTQPAGHPAGQGARVSRPGGDIAAPPASQTRLVEAYGKLPLRFEANQGQTDRQVKFLSRGRGYGLFLTPNEAVLSLQAGKSEVKGQKAKGKNEDPAQSALRNPNPEPSTPAVLHMKLVGANPDPQVRGEEELPGKSNYFIGNDPKNWRTGVSNYAKVQYHDVYPGVNLVYYGNQGQLEYDWVVSPGADPKNIRFGIEGTEKISIDGHGDLVLQIEGGEVRFHKPVVYQEESGVRSQESGAKDHRQFLDGRFVLRAANPKSKIPNPKWEVGFEIASYDPTLPLVIDPVLTYSTFLGGSALDQGFAIAVDGSGNAYVTGVTSSTDFPTQAPLQSTNNGGQDVFVSKFDPSGASLLYSTYLGGTDFDFSVGIAVDTSGDAFVLGITASADFPTTPGAFQTTTAGGSCFDFAGFSGTSCHDAFLAKLNPAGSALAYSTYIGGSGDELTFPNFVGGGIALDSAGNAYVTGQTNSADFPVTPGVFQMTYSGGTCGMDPNTFPCFDAFVAKVNASGTSLVYATYLGGIGEDEGMDIALDTSGDAYVTGNTFSTNFPTTGGAYQTTCNGCGSGNSVAFVTKLNPTGTGLDYSTYVGGTGGDIGIGIALDSARNAVVSGNTSSVDFPTTVGAFQTIYGGGYADVFVAKLNSAGSALLYSTYLGGSGGEDHGRIAIDASGDAYVTGATKSTDFPLAAPIQNSCGGCPGSRDIFVSKLNASGSALVFSTYLGGTGDEQGEGIALDTSSNVYLIGKTVSADFPITPGAFQPTCGSCGIGRRDAFVAKLTGLALPVVSLVPASLDFGNQAVGVTSSARYVTLSNVGDGTLTFTSFNVQVSTTDSTASPDFTANNTCGTSIPGGSSCTIYAFFTPTAVGTRTAVIKITDSAATSPQFVNLTGNGVPAPIVGFSVPSLAFGNQRVGTTSAAQSVTLTNTGTAVMTITSITTYGDFDATHDCPLSPSTLAIGAFCTIDVTFSPTVIGGQAAYVYVYDDAPSSPQSVYLTGTGIASAIRAAHKYYYFDVLPVGSTSAPQAVTVTNSGSAPLTVASVVASGDFAVASETCTASAVAVGANCTVDVTFTPTADFRRLGTLTFNSDAQGGPSTVGLIGASALRLLPEFTANVFPGNDDGSTGLIPLPFTVNFFGNSYTGLYVNNNGNVTFDQSLGTYTPFDLTSTSTVIIAPFFADVDTRGVGSDVVTYGAGTINGRQAFGVNWINVGYYGGHADKLNSFQLVLIDRSDTGAGTVDIEFNYGLIQWETGDASGGSGGLGGFSARAGYSNGTGLAGTFYEFGGSAVNGAFLDSNPASGLVYRGDNGRVNPLVRGGEVVALSVSPTSVNFPGNPLNIDCPSKTVTLTNQSADLITITSIVASGNFTATHTCGTGLAAGASCTVSVQFHPTVVGTATGTITIADNATGNPHTVALSGTVTPTCSLLAKVRSTTLLRGTDVQDFEIADGHPSCSPVSLTLSCSVANPAACALNPAVIAPSGASTLRVSNLRAVRAESVEVQVNSVSEFRAASELISVRFSDFAFTQTPDTASVRAGETASYSLAIRPINGLAGPLALTCSGAPRGATCTVQPSAVALDGSSLAQVRVRVSTAARAGALPPIANRPFGFGGDRARRMLLLMFASLALLVPLGAGAASRRRTSPVRTPALQRLVLAAAMLAMLLWAACGGGGSMNFNSGGTPAGTFTLTITGTYTAPQGTTPATLSNTTALTLKVN